MPLLQRWQHLGTSERWLLLEAVLALSTAAIVIRLMPLRSVAALAARGKDRAPPDEARRSDLIRSSTWAIEASARRMPWKTVCFQKGLALQFLLRRRGVLTRLHYGVGKAGNALSAHVWITDRGRPIMGGQLLEDHVCLAVFP